MGVVQIGSVNPGLGGNLPGRVFYPQARALLQVVFDGFGPTSADTDPLVIPVLPKSVTIHKNSYKQADSWEMTFDGADLPIDPQLVRAGAVEIHLFQVERMNDEKRVLGRQLNALGAAASEKFRGPLDKISVERLKDADDEFTDQLRRFLLENEPQIAGLFDQHSIKLGSDGRTVSISGQDYTQLLMGKQWPPTPKGRARKIPVGRRIDLIMEEILEEADPTGRLRLEVREISAATLPTVQSPIVRGKKRGIPVGQDTSYWDVLYKLATRHSLICFVDGLKVVLTRPQNLTDKEVSRVRKFTWGENIQEVSVSRKLGKEKVPRIIVRGYDQQGKEVVEESFPTGLPKPKQPRKGKKGATTQKFQSKSRKVKKRKTKKTITRNIDDEYEIIPVRGITDRAVLRRTAEMVYNLRGKGEHKITLSTRDLTTFNLAGGRDDVLNLAAGDAIWIEWDPFNRELLSDAKVPREEKVQALVRRGYGRAVSEVIADSYAKLEAFRRPLRVREVSYSYDTGSGISIEIELIDFIVIDGIRSDKAASILQDQTPFTDFNA